MISKLLQNKIILQEFYLNYIYTYIQLGGTLKKIDFFYIDMWIISRKQKVLSDLIYHD